ncbi:hypothetical protein KAR28_06975 [Candidatus Parcubacteria bacterium]|nr:hypothetical protein [Candidatus Parcubacteria bacterium]
MEIIKLIFQQLNNKELATIIWGIFLFFLIMIFSSSFRKSFWSLIKMFFSGKIFLMLAMNTILFLILIIGMKYFQIWNNIFYKDAIFWFLASFIMLSRANEALTEKNHYKRKFLNLLKWETIIIFIISLHSFSLVQELIFIPIFIGIIIFQALASTKKDSKQLESFLDILIILILLFLIGFTVKNLIVQPKMFLVVSDLYLFIFPVILTIFYIPFLYVFSLYMIYESFFIRLNTFLKDEFSFKNKLQIIFICKLKISNVKKFQNQALKVNYIRSESDLLDMIKCYEK